MQVQKLLEAFEGVLDVVKERMNEKRKKEKR